MDQDQSQESNPPIEKPLSINIPSEDPLSVNLPSEDPPSVNSPSEDPLTISVNLSSEDPLSVNPPSENPPSENPSNENTTKNDVEKIPSKKRRKFQVSWLNLHQCRGWLRSHEDDQRAYCTLCEVSLTCSKSELIKHANRRYHVNNVILAKKKENDPKSPSSSLLVSEDYVLPKNHIANVKNVEEKLSAFFAEHNVPLDAIDHFVPLMKDIFSDSIIARDVRLSRTKCTDIVRNIGKNKTATLVTFLRDQRFSILLGAEISGASNKRFFPILVRYLSPLTKKCATELLELVELDFSEICFGETIFTKFKTCFEKHEIPLKNIVGMMFCDDSSMESRDLFLSKLKEEVPALVVLNGISHSFGEIAKKAISKLPYSIVTILNSISSYITNAQKTVQKDNQVSSEIDSASLSIAEQSDTKCESFDPESWKNLKLSETKWFVLHKHVVKILDNWEFLRNYFYTESEGKKSKAAKLILDMLNNDKCKAYVLFLKYILIFFDRFHALLQTQKIVIHKLAKSCEQLIKQVGCNFMLPVAMNNITSNNLIAENFLPADELYVGPECNLFLENKPFEYRNEIKSTCLGFYVAAMEEMLTKLPHDDSFLRELNFLSSDVALSYKSRWMIRDLREIASRFGENFDMSKLEFEWVSLSTEFDDENKDSLARLEVDDMWRKIFARKDISDEPKFPQLEKLVDIAFTIPHSDAYMERIYSLIMEIKNEKRNRFSVETLNALCKIRSYYQEQNVNCQNNVDSSQEEDQQHSLL